MTLEEAKACAKKKRYLNDLDEVGPDVFTRRMEMLEAAQESITADAEFGHESAEGATARAIFLAAKKAYNDASKVVTS